MTGAVTPAAIGSMMDLGMSYSLFGMTPNIRIAVRPEVTGATTLRLPEVWKTLTLRMEDLGMDRGGYTPARTTRESSETDSSVPFTNSSP